MREILLVSAKFEVTRLFHSPWFLLLCAIVHKHGPHIPLGFHMQGYHLPASTSPSQGHLEIDKRIQLRDNFKSTSLRFKELLLLSVLMDQFRHTFFYPSSWVKPWEPLQELLFIFGGKLHLLHSFALHTENKWLLAVLHLLEMCIHDHILMAFIILWWPIWRYHEQQIKSGKLRTMHAISSNV